MIRMTKGVLETCGDFPEIPKGIDVLDYFIYAHEYVFSELKRDSSHMLVKEMFEKIYKKTYGSLEMDDEKKWWALHLLLLSIVVKQLELPYATNTIDMLLKKIQRLSTSEIKNYVNETAFIFQQSELPCPILRPSLATRLKSSIVDSSVLLKNEELIRAEMGEILREVGFRGLKKGAFSSLELDLYKVENGFCTVPELVSDLFILHLYSKFEYLLSHSEKNENLDSTQLQEILNFVSCIDFDESVDMGSRLNKLIDKILDKE